MFQNLPECSGFCSASFRCTNNIPHNADAADADAGKYYNYFIIISYSFQFETIQTESTWRCRKRPPDGAKFKNHKFYIKLNK